MQHCQKGEKAKVIYVKENGQEQQVIFDAPVDVETFAGEKCWRYAGIGDDGVSYEHFQSGFTPEYRPRSPKGFWLYMDGNQINPTGVAAYYYVSGTSITEVFQRYKSASVSTGSCFSSSSRGLIKIAHPQGVFEDFYKKDTQYLVSCGDECPEGFLKCDTSVYPGYCCIPCGEIKSEIAVMRSIIRGLNG